MFGSEILEVAIGLFFIFLLLSLVASAIREMIEAWLKTRSADLHRGVRELLGGDDGLTEDLYKHPLVQSLYLDAYEVPRFARTTLPSYIPSANFALALLDLAARPPASAAAPGTPEPPLSLAGLQSSVQKVTNPAVRRVLQIAVDRAEGDFARAQANVEAWFNSSMDRVSGWYKRRTQYILFGIGLVVAVVAHVDTIATARYLYHNDIARSAIAVRAEVLTAAMNKEGGAPDTVSDTLRRRVTAELDSLKAAGLPIGWRTRTAADSTAGTLSNVLPTSVEEVGSAFQRHILGWLLTAFAISLGAPFWFDVLNKVMVIRSTVKPHEKSPEEGSEDKQPKGGANPPRLGGTPGPLPAGNPTPSDGGATTNPPT